MITYKEFNVSLLDEIKEIYELENWKAYLNNDEKLINAFNNSSYVFGAFDKNNLIGFIRCVGDDEHIVLIQDLIVRKNYQRRGIGTYLISYIMKKYEDVRMLMVCTDIDDKIDNEFYRKMGFNIIAQKNIIGYIR